jgi:flagellar protein FlgJ
VGARFVRYESMEACFADRDRLITRLAVYAHARAAASDPEAFVRALARHWATDPKYADKLLSLYRAHRLDALDRS